jgi:hypothetical protein
VPQSLANPEAQARPFLKSPPATRVLDAPFPVRIWHLASLDAPTVAVVWALGFAWTLEVHLPIWLLIALALAVWVLYVADRLLDARAGQLSGCMERLRARHRFHWAHRRVLAPMAIVAAGCAAGMVLILMPAISQQRDTVLAAAALAYLTRVHSGAKLTRIAVSLQGSFPTKEISVGILFAVGCALPAVNQAAFPPWRLALPVAYLAGLAWLDCCAIERWEAGRHSIFRYAITLCIAGLFAAAWVCVDQPRPAALLTAGATSAFLLALLDWQRTRLTPLALRVAADLVLLTPLALLWR